MGALIADQEYSIEGWKFVWLTCCIVSLVGEGKKLISEAKLSLGGIFYALVTSAEEQPWSKKKMTVREQLKFEWQQFSDYFRLRKNH